jgi:hypothetical protein
MTAKIVAGVLLLLLLPAPAASAAPGLAQTPGAYYLALGDSMAYGFQPTKASLPPSGFRTGYVDVFAARLRALAPKIRIVNYGCPGESTRPFVGGAARGSPRGGGSTMPSRVRSSRPHSPSSGRTAVRSARSP